MTKIGWKVINGYGPYAYLQESVWVGGGKVVTKHIAYLGKFGGTPGRSGNNNRMSLEGMIWITRTGAPWRDLPKEFGNWNTVHRRFRRWAQSGVFQRIFDVVEEDLDLKAVMVDGTFTKVHQHGAGAKKAAARLRSRLIDKLSAAVEAGLRPISRLILPYPTNHA